MASVTLKRVKMKGKKLTPEEFVRKSKEVHGEKYDYSFVEYLGYNHKVKIICPIHGDFLQLPFSHISGVGCPLCGKQKKKRPVAGIGICDVDGLSATNVYKEWRQMLKRCYDEDTQQMQPTYKSCFVCDEWAYLSKFKQWYDEHYVEGWQLDKDILVKGNKIYSPLTCCFVPRRINTLFLKRLASRGNLPIGVKKSGLRYQANLKRDEKTYCLGTFASPEEAFQAYKKAKEKWIKEIADRWKDQLEPRVYEAMYNYKVEITD